MFSLVGENKATVPEEGGKNLATWHQFPVKVNHREVEILRQAVAFLQSIDQYRLPSKVRYMYFRLLPRIMCPLAI